MGRFRSNPFALPIAALALSLAAAARAEITPEAKKVVDRYVEATGGGAARLAVHSLRAKASVSALGLTGVTWAWSRMPDLHATETSLGPFKLREGFDGSKAWRTDPSTGKVVMLDGKDLEDAKSGAYFENEAWIEPDQAGGKVALVGTEKDSTGTYTVLEVTPPAGRPRRLGFEPKTGLLGRVVAKRDQQTVVISLSDYRRVGGALFPYRSLAHVTDMPANDLLVTVDSMWVNEEIPDSRFSPPGEEVAAPRYLQTPGVAKLPFEYRGRHVWLKVSVNGGEPADFIYDTGASITILDSAYAARLGLATQGQLQSQGAGATGTAAFSKLEVMRVLGAGGDGVEVKDQKVGVLSLNGILAPFFWRDVAGVVGYDFISRFVNQIDYDARVVTLHDPGTFRYTGSATGIPFTLAGTVPAVHMKLDGEYEGDFRLDVGSSSTVDLHSPFVKRYDLASKVGRTIEGMSAGFGGMFHSRAARMKKIQIGPYSWERPIVVLSGAESGALASEDYAGNVGNQILERFRCTLDYERRLVYLEPGRRYDQPDRFSKAGLLLGRYGDTVRSMEVLPESPAAKAGMRTGDLVVTVNDKPILGYSPDDLEAMFENGKAGETIAFEIAREGKKKKVKLRLEDLL